MGKDARRRMGDREKLFAVDSVCAYCCIGGSGMQAPHPPDNAEFEVFSDSRRFFYDFFLEKVTLYGEVAIKSR